jgi:hypothetical protein
MARRVKGTFRSTAVTTSARSRAEGSVSQHSRESVRAKNPDSYEGRSSPGRRYEDWVVDDPAGQDLDHVHASLGCGNSVAVAELREGDKVLDLGSGGGFDVLLSAQRAVRPGSHTGRHDRRDARSGPRQYGIDFVGEFGAG